MNLPDVSLVLYNVSKRSNWGTLIRSAAAHNIHDIFVVGSNKLKTFGNQVGVLSIQFIGHDKTSEFSLLG